MSIQHNGFSFRCDMPHGVDGKFTSDAKTERTAIEHARAEGWDVLRVRAIAGVPKGKVARTVRLGAARVLPGVRDHRRSVAPVTADIVKLARAIVDADDHGEPLLYGDKDKTTAQIARALIAEHERRVALEDALRHIAKGFANVSQHGNAAVVDGYFRGFATETLKRAAITTKEPTPVDDDSRCAVCGWPLRLHACQRGDCSQRPRPKRLYAPERAAAEHAALTRGSEGT